jgi:tripartite-type tricarboxylate transporter receptor subunit TctC
MKRNFVGAFLAVLLVGPAFGQADPNYPTKPIRIIVPFPAGSATDSVCRVVAQKLQGRIGQTVVVENKPGASGSLGSDQVAKATPDGYTLGLITGSTHTVAPALGKLPYDPVKDFKPISMLGSAPYVLVVQAGLKVSDVPGLVALAKAKPATLTYGSAGTSSLAHLAAALLEVQSGIKLAHVPYRSSGQSVIDLMTGRLDMQFATIAPTLESIRSGKVIALATTSSQRASALPQVPTMMESGFPDYDVQLWMAFALPKDTPDAVVTVLNQHLGALLADGEMVELLQQQGFEARPTSPDAVMARIRSEGERWRVLIAKTGIKAE